MGDRQKESVSLVLVGSQNEKFSSSLTELNSWQVITCSLWDVTQSFMYYLWEPLLILAVRWFWRLITEHSPRRPGFDPSSAHATFVVEKVALGEIFLRVLRSFSCHCHSTNSPHSSQSTHCSYQKDKRAKPENLPKNSSLPETAELGTEMYLHFFVFYSVRMRRKW